MDVSLCTACVLANAGYSNREIGWLTPEDPDPLGKIGPGFLAGRDDDADPYFGWAPCDGCGQSLGGDRYAYTFEPRGTEPCCRTCVSGSPDFGMGHYYCPEG